MWSILLGPILAEIEVSESSCWFVPEDGFVSVTRNVLNIAFVVFLPYLCSIALIGEL